MFQMDDTDGTITPIRNWRHRNSPAAQSISIRTASLGDLQQLVGATQGTLMPYVTLGGVQVSLDAIVRARPPPTYAQLVQGARVPLLLQDTNTTMLPLAPAPCMMATPVNSAPLFTGRPASSSPRVLRMAPTPCMTPNSTPSPLRMRVPATSSPLISPFSRTPCTSRAITSSFYTGIPTNSGTRVPSFAPTIRMAGISAIAGSPHTPLRPNRTPTSIVRTVCTGVPPAVMDISPVNTIVVEETQHPDAVAPPPPVVFGTRRRQRNRYNRRHALATPSPYVCETVVDISPHVSLTSPQQGNSSRRRGRGQSLGEAVKMAPPTKKGGYGLDTNNAAYAMQS